MVENILGRIRNHRGDHEQAMEHHTHALAHASAIESRLETARARSGMAAAAHVFGDLEAAEHHRTEADALFDAMGVPPEGRRHYQAQTVAPSAQGGTPRRCPDPAALRG